MPHRKLIHVPPELSLAIWPPKTPLYHYFIIRPHPHAVMKIYSAIIFSDTTCFSFQWAKSEEEMEITRLSFRCATQNSKIKVCTLIVTLLCVMSQVIIPWPCINRWCWLSELRQPLCMISLRLIYPHTFSNCHFSMHTPSWLWSGSSLCCIAYCIHFETETVQMLHGSHLVCCTVSILCCRWGTLGR